MKLLDVYKRLTWKIKYDTGDMPYPPVIFWEKNIKINNVKIAWESTIKHIKSKNINHNMWLYVHIPFCYTRCFFCTCVTEVEHNENKYDEYLDLIEKESQIFSPIFKDVEFNTVYVWWWTPTILTPNQIDRFYKILKKYFNLSNVYQIMTEGSPYTTTKDKLKILKKHWVNKITFWVQSLDWDTLKTNNRAQQAHHVVNAVSNAKELGINNINIDIMAGLPGQSKEWFLETIKLIDEEIKPTTTHVNAFWPTKNTTFDKSWKKYTLEDIERRNEMRKLGHYLEEKKHSIHDSLLTHNVQLYNSKNFNSSIFWLGYWAISHAFWSLHYTKRSFDEYKKWLNEWVDISFNWYNLSFEDEMIAYVINNYRNGVYFEKFKELFHIDIIFTKLYNKIQLLIDQWIITIKENEKWKYFCSSKNSDLFSTIFSKSLYDDKILERYIRDFNIAGSEYDDISLKLKQFFTD